MPFILNGGASIGQPYAPLSIVTGTREVVISGTVMTVDNGDLQFQLGELRIVLTFATDGTEPRFGSASAVGSSLTIALFNFNNPLGSGTTAPLEIGTLNRRKLFLAFMIHAVGGADGPKVVHYTFMVGESA